MHLNDDLRGIFYILLGLLSYEPVTTLGVSLIIGTPSPPKYPESEGLRQSPISIQSSDAVNVVLPPLNFHNYDALLGELVLENDGHTINMAIPPIWERDERPSISGGSLPGHFEAIGLHFHWGSLKTNGAEHLIDGFRYDVEMHVVHKNVKYATFEEAIKHPDGIAVLGVLLSTSARADHVSGLNRIFDRLPELIEYKSKVSLGGLLSLGQFLGNLNKQNYFSYQGSLTTPPYSEAVTWIVFPDALYASPNQIQKLFDVQNEEGEPLINNYREVQPLNGRPVVRRISEYENSIPFPIAIGNSAKLPNFHITIG